MTLTALKKALTPGTKLLCVRKERVEVNEPREVIKCTASILWMLKQDGGQVKLYWPKAAQVLIDDAGFTVTIEVVVEGIWEVVARDLRYDFVVPEVAG